MLSHRRALWALVAAYAAAYAGLCLRRYETFHAQIDLSYYLREIWGIAHGRYDLPLVQAPHFLGLHLEPVLLPLVLLSAAGAPLGPALLLLQAAAVALLAWPAHRMAARHLGPGGPALLVAALALLYPTVTVATLHDFHPVTLALAPLLGVIDALDEGRPRRALWLGLLALLCREDIALQLLCVCLAWGLRPGTDAARRRACLLAGALLLGYFLAYVVLVQPRFVPPQGSYALHFPRLGGAPPRSGRDVLAWALGHPLWLVQHLLTPDRLAYPLLLLLPVGLLPLLRPGFLLGAAPILAINLLSDFPRVRTLESHYTTAVVPFVIGAAILGAGVLSGWLQRRLPRLQPSRARALVLGPWLALTLLCHYAHGGSPLALHSARFHWSDFRDGDGAAALRAAVRAVPPGVSVAARPGPLAHLAERPRALSPPEFDDGRPVERVLKE